MNDGTETAKLMQYFKTADPDDLSQGDLSKRIVQMKEGELESMYDVANDFIAIGREVALKAVRLYLDGNDLAEIAKQVRADEEDVKSMLVEAGVFKE